MPNYQDGKIYKIVCRITNLIYIGSTTNKYLCNRLGQHKYAINNKNLRQSTSKEVLKNNDYYIELIELVPCNSKDELTKRERFYIESTDCVNKCVPGRTSKEYYSVNKDKLIKYQTEYNEQNKEKISEHKKIYREQNKDIITEYAVKYRENNKEKISERQKLYRDQNKEKISEKKKQYYANQKLKKAMEI